MILAIVKVLPEPVTPRRVSHWLPSLKPLTRSAMAWGWSPVGLYSDTNSKWSIVNLSFVTFLIRSISATLKKFIRNKNVKIRKWYCLILDFSQFVHEKSQNISRNAIQNTLSSIHILLFKIFVFQQFLQFFFTWKYRFVFTCKYLIIIFR